MQVNGFEDTIAWYDRNAEEYAKTNDKNIDFDQLDEFSALLPEHAKVLDAGCAAGRDSKQLLDRNFEVTGVDISEGLLKLAKERYANIEFMKADFRQLPFADKTFDGVWAHQSLLHLETQEDVVASLKEFVRVMNDSGVILILVKAQTGASKTEIVNDAFSNHDRFFQYFTKDELDSMLTSLGLHSVKLEQYREIDKNPNGRAEVSLILSISRK